MSEDQRAREGIAKMLDQTFLVEAGAGSGKTTSLVSRMIALIESGDAVISEIAAITFTRKAADELRTRFRLELEKRIRMADESCGELLGQALAGIDRCYIGTIHAFCGRLLRERPIEARLDPAFRELEEEESTRLRHQFWDEYLLNLLDQEQSDVLATLGALRANIDDLRQVYERVCEYTDVEIVTSPTMRPDFELIRLSLPPMMDEAVLYIPQTKPQKGWDSLQSLVRDGRRFVAVHGLQDDLRVLELAFMFERNIEATLNRWTDSTKAKAFKTMFQEWQRKVLQPFLRAWREYVYPQLVDIVRPAVEYGARRRQEMGLLDFQDLLMRATALLREHRDVRRYFHKTYTRLFVDEFQDTDPIQAELMFLLTGDDANETDWRQLTPRPGSLFVVGDPKQSIYRFRRADISTYNWVKHKIKTCGEVLQLRANFRAVHALGDYVNDAFTTRFPPDETEQQAAFVKMETKTINPADDVLHGVYTITHAQIPGGKAMIASADADRVARYIAAACHGQLTIQEKGPDGLPRLREAKPDDFMIILKRREFVQLYAEYLEKYGIPTTTSGSSAQYEELHALSLLVDCLDDPRDRISLLAVLKGTLFAVSDDALYHYKMQGFPLTYTYLPDRVEVVESALSTYEALVKLAEYAHMVRKRPALTALTQMIEDLGIIPFAAVRPNGQSRTGTLIKLLHVLHQDKLNVTVWSELRTKLSQLVTEAKLECMELFTGQQGAVQIMNLHKAKGLEAPVVILACPCGDTDHDASEHIDRSMDPAQGYFSITRRVGYRDEMIAHPASWQQLAEKERLFMNAEKERLLYVAATRAKQLMIISRYPARPAIDPWHSLGDGIGEDKELVIPHVEEIRMASYDQTHDEEAALQLAHARRQKLAVPTYQATSVTELVKSVAVQPPRPKAGRGMAFGTTVHRCIELLSKAPDEQTMERNIRMIAAEEGMDDVLVPDVLSMLTDITHHSLWHRSLLAKRRIHELSIRTVREGNVPDHLSGSRLFLSGVIDFLFEEESGWVVVDFKTDTYESGQQQAFVDYYRPQVLAYKTELEQAFRLSVKEMGLYFLHGNEYIVV